LTKTRSAGLWKHSASKRCRIGYVQNVKAIVSNALGEHDLRDPFQGRKNRWPDDAKPSVKRETLDYEKLSVVFGLGVGSGYLDDAMLGPLCLLSTRRLGILPFIRGCDLDGKHGVDISPKSILPASYVPTVASFILQCSPRPVPIPLAIITLIAIYKNSESALLILGTLAGFIQLLDGGVGLLQHDLGKSIGPLVIAALQFSAIDRAAAGHVDQDDIRIGALGFLSTTSPSDSPPRPL
jgi:hypothetical protein